MKNWKKVMALCLAAALVLGLSGCQGVGLAGSLTPGGVPSRSEETPEKELPGGSELSAEPAPAATDPVPAADPLAEDDDPAPGAEDPAPSLSDEAPFETGDVPAMPLDEDATLLVTLEGMEEEVAAVFHHSTLGYSMVYDAALALSEWENGDSYATSLEGTYLAVTTVGLATEEEAIEGLKLQNGIEGEAGLTNFGAKGYEGRTLHLEDGALRVDWLVCRHNEVIWLIEMSVSGTEAVEGWGVRFRAMLDTIEFL